MTTKDLLLEIGTEELPAKNLEFYLESLKEKIRQSFIDSGIYSAANLKIIAYGTPRRLTVIIKDLPEEQPTRGTQKLGPAKNAAYDANGKPTKALLGFIESCNADLSQITTLMTEKGERILFTEQKPAYATKEVISEIMKKALSALPVTKPMRWGSGVTEFIRPVEWVVLLYGDKVIDAEILGKKTNNLTRGHRFLAPQTIELKNVSDYEAILEKNFVIANLETRRNLIKNQVMEIAKSLKAIPIIPDDLLDEVTNLVEYPIATLANFDPQFLEVPQEALISAMHGHQKSFPIEDAHGKLLPHFIFVSNLQSKAPQQVIAGNEKVMRARLSDAKFFYDTDTQHSLESFLPRLKNVVFQAKLGTTFERTQRISGLAGFIARQLKLDIKEVQLVERAGELCKADLMTGMVNEFPELQGIMGYYYAIKSGEDKHVAKAIRAHYLPTFSGDQLPNDSISQCVALADKLNLLVGIFGINQAPTGDKDPFGLRRAAIGVIRILIENGLDVNLQALLEQTTKLYGDKLINPDVVEQALDFIYERIKAIYGERGISIEIFNAARAIKPTCLYDFNERIKAVKEFSKLPEAENLAAANKRVHNILTKQNGLNIYGHIDAKLLQLPAEQKLFSAIQEQNKVIKPLLDKKDYTEILSSLAHLRAPIDQFFDDVMVMVDDETLRHNRLLLLNQLRQLFLTVADISLL
jgi:glycyl-tRNA synthetase beta chain